MPVLIRIGLLSHTSSLRTAQTRARAEERQRTQKRAQARTIHPKASSHTLAVSCTRTYTSTCPRAHASTHTGKQTATLARPLRARLHTRARSHKPAPPPQTHTLHSHGPAAPSSAGCPSASWAPAPPDPPAPARCNRPSTSRPPPGTSPPCDWRCPTPPRVPPPAGPLPRASGAGAA